jgi:hypothetical protein
MQKDNVASPDAPGFADLRLSSTSLEDILPTIVGPSRPTCPLVLRAFSHYRKLDSADFVSL